MLFSPSCEYAIRAMIYLASQEAEKPFTVSTIAQEAGVPTPFLAKILLNMKNHGILKATKGPGGGYFLGRPPEEIILYDIVRACDGPKDLGNECVLGLDRCSDVTPCPLHFEWKRFKAEVDIKIHRLNLKELQQKLLEKKSVLRV
ncbi:MAG: Rrf2 family transcriptional regulator [Acidobacteria bacterium]|nr:Rrf2 family transcriptional regulator [Acidobacteriota bacterium]MCB9397470.1 Rrf2 family transcriptional regulator [Acidobacteriota bacterium]